MTTASRNDNSVYNLNIYTVHTIHSVSTTVHFQFNLNIYYDENEEEERSSMGYNKSRGAAGIGKAALEKCLAGLQDGQQKDHHYGSDL